MVASTASSSGSSRSRVIPCGDSSNLRSSVRCSASTPPGRCGIPTCWAGCWGASSSPSCARSWIFTDPLGPARVLSGLTPPDLVGQTLRFLANGKFLALLSLMFGIGLELQYQSARRRGTRWPGWYLWRAALLFVEGLLHYLLVFEFDVLMSYAVIVAWLIGRGDRAVRAWMITLGALHVLVVGLLTVVIASAVPSSTVSFATDSWTDQVLDRIMLAPVYRIEALPATHPAFSGLSRAIRPTVTLLSPLNAGAGGCAIVSVVVVTLPDMD